MASDYSKRLRSRGNEVYKEACSEYLAPVVRSSRFLKASNFYRQALEASRCEDERAKCSKNLGAVHWKHAKLALEYCDNGKAPPLQGRHPSLDVQSSIEFYLAALRHGKASYQRQEWKVSIENILEEIVTSLFEEHEWLARGDFLLKLCKLFQSGLPSNSKSQACAIIHLGYSQRLFDKAVRKLKRRHERNGGSYRECLALLHGCEGPIEEAQRRARLDFVGRVKTLKASVESCRATCESIQAREAGKRFLEESVKARDEASRHDLVIAGLDKFKEAVVLARGVDAECEAEALSCIGDLYREVFKKDSQAHPYYSMVVLLAQNSDAIQSAKWYKRAKVALNMFFNRRQEGPQTTANVLPQIKGAIDRLETQFKSLNTEGFLRYLYKSHPPRANKGGCTLGELGNAEQIRAAVRKAIQHYHPDHNSLGDEKWSALCGEITKLLLQKKRSLQQC